MNCVNVMMKTIPKIAAFAVLVFGGSSRCSAVQVTHLVADAQYAQELGAMIGWEPYGTNDIKVWLEFSPHYQLARFKECDLKIVSDGPNLADENSDGPMLVSTKLPPTQLTNDRVVFFFAVSREFVAKSSLRLVVGDETNTAYYVFPAKAFVKAPPAFTFIGVPRTISTNSFEDVGGLKRVIKVYVLTAGGFGLPQENVSFYANWPWPALGARYWISAVYEQHGQAMIFDYRQIK